MNQIGDYQILDVLNPARSNSSLFLIKEILTGEKYVWRRISLRNLSKDKKEELCNKIRQRIQQKHVLLVKFYPVIEDEKSKLVYVPMEYFPHGNLSDFIKKFEKSGLTHISEEIVVKLLFQLLILVKNVAIYDKLHLGNIYFDEDLNLKFLNFSHCATQLHKINIKLCDIGNIILRICTLKSFVDNQDILLSTEYSKEFHGLIETIIQDFRDVDKCFEDTISHPVILLNTFRLNSGLKINGCFEIVDYRKKLEYLRKKETLLKAKEHKVVLKEHSLNVKEKKLQIEQKAVKDKTTQAELHFRRCKENKISFKNRYETVDTSTAEYEALDVSDIVQTSKKLDVDKLEKPHFIRTFSEKKVKFKGHSPLKKMDFNRGKSLRKSKSKLPFKEQTLSPQIQIHKYTSNVEKNPLKPIIGSDNMKRRTILFGPKIVIQDESIQNLDCKPIMWTEESKKQAFDLLRFMNSSSDRLSREIKHTYL